jgi:quercetin dioxygenase-like cupin family protein
MTLTRIMLVGLVALAAFGGIAAADSSGDKTLLENDRVVVMEYVFPPGFKGDEHAAPVDELAYVLDGQFTVVTKGKGKTVVKKGQVEWAPKGTVHYSVNDSKRPARVLVVMLKER